MNTSKEKFNVLCVVAKAETERYKALYDELKEKKKTQLKEINNGYVHESQLYNDAIKKAQTIISKLQYLSTVPVPESFTQVEDEKTVVELKEKIIEAHQELEAVKANVPTYEIPERYL